MRRSPRPLGRAYAAALAIALASVGGASGSGRIVGGSAIQVQSAPWAVMVRNAESGEYDDCTGSIVDAQHVLTAAHCVFDSTGTLATPAQLSVRAGISNFASPLSSDAEQDRSVSSFSVHAGYTYSTSPGPDDVAVIALAAPLDLSGPAVKAVALPAPGSPLPSGTSVGLAGFGEETSGAQANGQLNWLTGTIDPQGLCGADYGIDDDAVRFCASSPTSASCEGDSGSGLVTTGSSPTLIGVLSAGATGCAPGSQTIFTYVAAPEILMFVQGDQQPPTAPRETNSTFVRLTWQAPLEVGTTLTCSSGNWSSQPASYAYSFVDTASSAVLARGPSPSFVPTQSDVGDTIACTALATNAGGTAAVTTTASPPIKPAPAGAAPRVASPPPGGTPTVSPVTARQWSAKAIETKADAIPVPSASAGTHDDVPQWDGYLRLALLGDQNPGGPRYRDTYVRCWSTSSWRRASASVPGSEVFASSTGALGFYAAGSSWIDLPIRTCVNAVEAARGTLDPSSIVALGSVLHETFDRQGISGQAASTCLGAVGVWQAVNRRVGPGPANHAFSLLLRWYTGHIHGAAAARLPTCSSRLHRDWNG